MATRTTYLKIGAFVMLAFSAAVATGILIGLSRIHRKYVSFYTYFDEAVTGLEVGSPVRARGVPIGQVGNITFAPDRRRIEVRSDIDVDAAERLGFPAPDERSRIPVPSNVRAQLASQGLTGARYIALDFFDEKTNPPPALAFAPPENYIPATRSLQNTLEQAATSAMQGVASVVETLQRERVSERFVHTTAEADEVLTLLRRMLRGIDQQNLPQRTTDTLEEIHLAASRINKVVERVDGDAGLIATAQQSVGAFGEAGRQATDTSRNLDETLEEMRSAAAAVRMLADQLERDPDMLLKGRSPERAP